MAENKRLKNLVLWLISQDIVASQQDLGERLGISNKSYLSQLVNGRAISPEFINKLSKLDPRINPDWLETGEGDMLIGENPTKQENKQENHDSGQQFNGPITGNNPQFAGRDFTANAPCSSGIEVDKVIAAMTAQAELTKEAHELTRNAQAQVDKAQSQIDRLLTMLETKYNK